MGILPFTAPFRSQPVERVHPGGTVLLRLFLLLVVSPTTALFPAVPEKASEVQHVVKTRIHFSRCPHVLMVPPCPLRHLHEVLQAVRPP